MRLYTILLVTSSAAVMLGCAKPTIDSPQPAPTTPEVSDVCSSMLRDLADIKTLGDSRRIERAMGAFTGFQAQFALETHPLSKAQCLAGMTVSTFYQMPKLRRMDEMPVQFAAGMVHLDAALKLLDKANAPREDATLCVDVANHFPSLVPRAGFVGPNQIEVTTARVQLLLRAVTRFRSIDNAEGELDVLRSLPQRSPGQLRRSIELAGATEQIPSFERAQDLELLARQVNQDDQVQAIEHMTDSVAILTQDSSHQSECAEAMLWLAILHKREHQRTEAIKYFKLALAIYQQQKKRDSRISYTARFLGSLTLEEKDPVGARAYYTLALKHQNSPRDSGESRMGLAIVHYSENNQIKATDTVNSGGVSSWKILASEFNRYFDTPIDSGIQNIAAALFNDAGHVDAADSILNWPHD